MTLMIDFCVWVWLGVYHYNVIIICWLVTAQQQRRRQRLYNDMEPYEKCFITTRCAFIVTNETYTGKRLANRQSCVSVSRYSHMCTHTQKRPDTYQNVIKNSLCQSMGSFQGLLGPNQKQSHTEKQQFQFDIKCNHWET